jgi:predicted nucleotidyltransferase
MRTERSDIVDPDPPSGGGASIALTVPVSTDNLFKHGASRYVLNFLADSPEIDVSIRALSRITPFSERATRQAVDALADAGLLEVDPHGNAHRVRINRTRLTVPTDPIESIPQAPYRTPVRVACQYLESELEEVRGIILFGSVARGDADRRSDIDLWILVDDDLFAARGAANKLARTLEELQIPPTISLAEAESVDFETHWETIRERLEAEDTNWASAERHSFELIVETPASILGQSDRVAPEKLFGEGITLRSTETLERVKREVITDE